jgi:hypothetical protein
VGIHDNIRCLITVLHVSCFTCGKADSDGRYYHLDHVIGTGYKPQGKWDIISIAHTTIYSHIFIWKSTKTKISRAVNQLKLRQIRRHIEIQEASQRVLFCSRFERNKNKFYNQYVLLPYSYIISNFYVHFGERNVKNRLVSPVSKLIQLKLRHSSEDVLFGTFIFHFARSFQR